jgi:hypothetical protein
VPGSAALIYLPLAARHRLLLAANAAINTVPNFTLKGLEITVATMS